MKVNGFLLLLPLWIPFVFGLTTLGKRRKAAAGAFLSRARDVVPLRVTQDYDMVVWHWRFWRWARTLDPSIDDPALLAASASLKKLDRIQLAVGAVLLPAVAAGIVLYPWSH
jgi:hypothetical protein